MLFYFSRSILLFPLMTLLLHASIWNMPYAKEEVKNNTLFTLFTSPPKHFDPVRSYSANEWIFLGQIYEPPLQYNYLKRPYTLEPLTLTSLPEVLYLDKNMSVVNTQEKRVAYTRYRFSLRDDIRYYPHAAFVKDHKGRLLYGRLNEVQLSSVKSVKDFPKQKSRLLLAEDYVYAIKRMAVRQYHSPILDTMAQYIVGLKQFSQKITKIAKQMYQAKKRLDLRNYDVEGIRVIDGHTFEITIKGKYPQFLYWMSMNFFAPIPWEVDLFYQQDGLRKKNISLDTAPVGTGAYCLVENNPNQKIVLGKNPLFHKEYYPSLTPEEINSSGVSVSFLDDAGKLLPFIDKAVYTLEKESIPLWNKFLQGYYDASSISSEVFDQAVQIGSSGNMGLSKEMKAKGIQMQGTVQPSVFYMAFNMVDSVVGGYSEAAKKLRQAISIAQDQEEYISIFMNERGVPAQGPIPPGIFGYEKDIKGTNFVVYDWVDGKRVRKSITIAKKLLAEAGYPNGISTETGKRLKLYYDTTAIGPDDRALMDWRRKQFEKLGIELVIRATDYNRFQEKVREGRVQIFSWGWNADYPDPENFLFLLYGPNATVDTGGVGINSANYKNPSFDHLFDEIKTMENTTKRLEKIEQMLQIVREDAPWVWGFYPKSLTLMHEWYKNVFPHAMANNTLKYKRIDPKNRVEKQQQWNQPITAPLYGFIVILLLFFIGLYRAYRKQQYIVIKKEKM
ncbi:MAG: ABC transporter substrate-binding protein [Sulfurovum sp.]|nr:ABC transporter substrate-binding protein [Sulfurovum sp.]MCB4776090.1 ABC transporter substrate-binding protein [Sulfurovum sp.]